MLRYCIIFFLLQLTLTCYGKTFNFLHWGLEDGLTNSQVVDLAQDKHGNIWIATEAGINLFDGRNFTLYDTTNSDIAGNSLNTLFYDSDTDQLWVGTKSGISIIDCATKTFLPTTPFDSIEMNNNIISFSKSLEGMWIANRFGKIIHFNSKNGKNKVYSKDNVPGLPEGNLNIFDNQKGEIYIGHIDDGMTIMDLRTLEIRRFVYAPGKSNCLPGNRVYSIIEDNVGNIWVGTHQGLALYNPALGTIQTFKHVPGDENSLQSDHVYMLRIFNGYELWIATDIGGLSILDLRMVTQQSSSSIRFRNLKATYNRYGLSSRNIRSILQDDYGNIWIGNHSSGVDLLSKSEPMFQTLPYLELGVNQKSIHGIYIDAANNLWIGNENEIAHFREGELLNVYDFSNFLTRPYARLNSIHNIDGKLLLGLYDDGMLSFNPDNGSFSRIKSSGNKDIFTLYESDDHKVFVGSHGLYIYENGEIKEAVCYNKGLRQQAIYSIIQDSSGNLWVGTYGDGIYIFDKKANLIHKITTKDGFCSNVIHQLYMDAKGGIWIATRHGLGYIKNPANPASFINFTHKNGLNDPYIHALMSDSVGNIWLSTNKGISRLNVADSTFRHYDYLDGIPRGSFMDNSVATDSSGKIYFGAQNGVCFFNPKLSDLIESPSGVRILDVKSIYNEGHTYMEQSVFPDNDGTIKLPYDRNSLKISFCISNLSQSDKVEYACMLDDIDKSWISIKDETSVTYRNLPPGKYTFKVKARMHKQLWTEDNIAEINIGIAPPLWLTWYAKLLYIILLVGIACMFLWLYKRRLDKSNRTRLEQDKAVAEQNLNNERLRFYTNVTHELRTPLTLILGPLEDMVQDAKLPKPYDKKVKTIRDSAIKLLDMVNQLLEFRKTETQNKKLVVSRDDIARLVRETGLRYQELNRNPNVIFDVKTNLKNSIIYFDSEIIHIILNNLLSNAIKYTPTGSITLELKGSREADNDYVEISVCDTGYGIEEADLPYIFDRFYQANNAHQASGTGIGLAIVKSLVELHQGILKVESKVGKGASFTVRLLANNTYPDAMHKESELEKCNTENLDLEEPDKTSDHRPLILVVEDNDGIRDYLLESLSDSYRIMTAVNGKEGVELALSEVPDIIVSDIMMPVMDGMEVCRKLKSNVVTSHIPIILLTAKNAIEDKEKGYEIGADSYLTKPFSARLLRNRIKNILDMRDRLFGYIRGQIIDNDSIRISLSENEDAQPVLNNLDNKFIQTLITLIEENIASDTLDMEFLQKNFGMSHSTLYRKVKGLTGLSTNEFIQKIKLRYAALLLKKGEMNINEVAYASGFNSLSYFSGKFKKEYGVLPSQYTSND